MSPGPGSQSSNRRVVSGSSLLRSPSKASFVDTQSTQNMHLGPHPPASAKVGKGQATEVFRRMGYWLYSTAPVQFIKHAMVEERNDSVNVMFSTDRSIWILGVSYRLKKNSKHVMLPVAIQADSSHLRMDSSLFLTHHHQRRSASPSRSSRARKQEPAVQRRSEDIPGNRRRANTSGAMMNKKKLQIMTQMQSYPGVPPIPEPSTPAMMPKHGLRPLASIPSQDLLRPRQNTGEPISPMPFPDEPAIAESTRSTIEPEADRDSTCISGGVSTAPGTRKSSIISQAHLQATAERPKSSKIDRLRMWGARIAKPMRRKSDVATELMPRENGPVSSAMISSLGSRPVSPQPKRASADTPGVGPRAIARVASNTGSSLASGSDPRSLGIGLGSSGLSSSGLHLRRRSKEALTSL
ncbi:hypothetical protein GGF43_005791, partial [Coemansia sp. RSA 2618]